MKKLAQILILASALLAGLQLGLYLTKSDADESSTAAEPAE
ncbi:hypothetical protein [Dasania marina]|tara:strand:+ start:13565 stop:13687 length:123 start_codon:yes stop_codon:yes gene_type:complete